MGPRQLKRRFDELCQRCFHSRSISHGGREREPDAESIPLAVKDQPFEGDAWDCRESPLQYRIAEEVLKVPGRFRRGGPPFVRITLSKPSFPIQTHTVAPCAAVSKRVTPPSRGRSPFLAATA